MNKVSKKLFYRCFLLDRYNDLLSESITSNARTDLHYKRRLESKQCGNILYYANKPIKHQQYHSTTELVELLKNYQTTEPLTSAL